ncbi:MAG TPA: TAT-variant-translocated molybdopterin oxidoreductase [Vicinamibacterales bacterium]|nr:TAT-variant-translocated molybdopterin oxidoreductase [Vicinamibacterales bacterium]
MDFSAIRSRLAGSEGRLYWRSLGELADTLQFREYLHREFPEQASQWNDPQGRRQFLKLMSASLALAGVSACTRQPAENIIPFVRQPENMVPGRPLFFATAIPFAGVAAPVLVESHEGHPTKIEGNPQHPASLGGTDTFTQASILDLYDPDRIKTVLFRGEVRGWGDFLTAMQTVLGDQRSKQGAGIRFLTETITSPTVAEQITLIRQAYPQARWHQWDGVPVGTNGAAPAGEPTYHFDKADVVVTLDADFLTCGPASIRYSRDFANRRKAGIDAGHEAAPAEGAANAAAQAAPASPMNRVYAIESTPTLTGAKADHRLALRASEIEAAARALSSGGSGGSFSNGNAAKFLAAAAKDLQAHRGRSVVVAGEYQPPAVHELARALNQSLGNVGSTVTYAPPVAVNAGDQIASIRDLAQAMDAGQVALLVIIGVNPVFTAPADLKFQEKLGKVQLSIAHTMFVDETATLCHWNLPMAHPLESWGDARAYDGTVTIMQPLIAPLYEGRTVPEVLATFVTAQAGKSAHDLVRDYWSRAQGGQVGGWTITDPTGEPFKSPDSFWKHALHDGWIAGTAGAGAAAGAAAINDPAPPAAGQAAAPAAGQTPAAAPSQPPAPAAAGGGLEIIFRPDPTIWDGRFANNGWLQELPKPITKITWDPTAWISPRLAESQHLRDGDIIELRYRGNTGRLPVTIVPGHPDNSVTAFFGYGRQIVGRVGKAHDDDAQQFDVFRLRTSDAPWFGTGLEIARTGDRYTIARTQEHHLMEDRDPVRAATLQEFQKTPDVISHMGHTPPRTMTLIPEWEYNGYKWGMAIDLTSCTGCGTCTIACQAENNIPVVGKDQVNRGREMHWIRVDHYFAGDLEDPKTYHQPVPCMQCEAAPCELVCPVGATTHSSEGLNDMVYNRCVGTRYCSNNCPYKVRRFNFLLYQDWETSSLEPLRNPDVTVRSRGVMEKCTYCVQRINYARIDAKREDRRIKDGEVVPACAAACPADAIVFGDLNDAESRVAKLKKLERNYGLLEDLNTRPRTTYLAAIRNPNPELEPAGGAARTTHD